VSISDTDRSFVESTIFVLGEINDIVLRENFSKKLPAMTYSFDEMNEELFRRQRKKLTHHILVKALNTFLIEAARSRRSRLPPVELANETNGSKTMSFLIRASASSRSA